MKFNHIYLPLALSIVVGIIAFKVGQQYPSKTTPNSAAQMETRQELLDLTAKDFEDYKNLKTLEERYDKADEILGKIVTVFLAELGTRIAFKATPPSALESQCNSLPQLADANQNPSLNQSAAPDPQPSEVSAPTQTPNTNASARSTPEQLANWKRAEAALLNLEDEAQAMAALKQLEYEDLYSSLRYTTPISKEAHVPIRGQLDGEIIFFDRTKQKSDWIISWTLNVDDHKRDAADSLIILSTKDDGKVFSRSNTSSGALGDVLRTPESKGLIINLRPDGTYMQIYPLKGNSRLWVGNVYEEIKRGQFKRTGTVRLSQR